MSDTETSISTDELPKIFDHYCGVDAAYTQENAGLGVANAKMIVELQKGCLSVSSSVDRGTTL